MTSQIHNPQPTPKNPPSSTLTPSIEELREQERKLSSLEAQNAENLEKLRLQTSIAEKRRRIDEQVQQSRELAAARATATLKIPLSSTGSRSSSPVSHLVENIKDSDQRVGRLPSTPYVKRTRASSTGSNDSVHEPKRARAASSDSERSATSKSSSKLQVGSAKARSRSTTPQSTTGTPTYEAIDKPTTQELPQIATDVADSDRDTSSDLAEDDFDSDRHLNAENSEEEGEAPEGDEELYYIGDLHAPEFMDFFETSTKSKSTKSISAEATQKFYGHDGLKMFKASVESSVHKKVKNTIQQYPEIAKAKVPELEQGLWERVSQGLSKDQQNHLLSRKQNEKHLLATSQRFLPANHGVHRCEQR